VNLQPILDSAQVELPCSVASITEIWASEEATRFLVGVILWNADKKPCVSIWTETDEIEVVDIEYLRQLIDQMSFSYGDYFAEVVRHILVLMLE